MREVITGRRIPHIPAERDQNISVEKKTTSNGAFVGFGSSVQLHTTTLEEAGKKKRRPAEKKLKKTNKRFKMKLERRKTGRRRRSYFRDSMVNLDEWRWEGGWRVAGGSGVGVGFICAANV